jgi:hypothetical protein
MVSGPVSDTIAATDSRGDTSMSAPRGGKRPGDRTSPRPAGVRAGRAGRPSAPRAVAQPFDEGFPMHAPRPFRPAIEPRPESTAGLRHEIADLRAEVRRLAANAVAASQRRAAPRGASPASPRAPAHAPPGPASATRARDPRSPAASALGRGGGGRPEAAALPVPSARRGSSAARAGPSRRASRVAPARRHAARAAEPRRRPARRGQLSCPGWQSTSASARSRPETAAR